MSIPYTPPWSRNYTSESNPVPENVHVPWTDVPWTDNPVTPEPTPAPAPDPVPAPEPTPAPPTPVPAPAPVTPVASGTFAATLEAQLEQAAKNAASAVLAKAQQAALNAASEHVEPTTPIVVSTKDVTNAAARSRALRSLVIGLGMAVLWGVLTAVGTAGHVDFFTKTGWESFFVLIGGAALNSVVSYVARLRLDPGLD